MGEAAQVIVQEKTETIKKKERVEIIDAARGLAVVLMVLHHAMFNLVAFFGAPGWLFSNPLIDNLRWVFIGVFMLVSGISSRFSRDNISRGAIVLLLGVCISYVTIRIIEMPILFGILSVLGTLMLFYGATRKLWDKIPLKTALVIYTVLIVFTTWARHNIPLTSDTPVVADILFALGWKQPGYFTYDYETIFPWLFVFLAGTRIGESIKNREFPKWFYEARFPFFPLVGRNALIIYVLHQPILYGLTMLVLQFR